MMRFKNLVYINIINSQQIKYLIEFSDIFLYNLPPKPELTMATINKTATAAVGIVLVLAAM